MSDIAMAVGHIPAGLFIVTTVEGDKKDGLLASWIQQASFDPLIISLAIKNRRVCYPFISQGGIFTVNIVGDGRADYLKHFWKGYDTSPFENIDHEITQEKGLVIKDARSAMVCRKVSQVRPGDHEIIFAEVLNSYVFNSSATSKVHMRKTGLTY